MEQSDKPVAFDQWGIVEVMGHKRFAGHITEQVIAGSALVRVDVPEVESNGMTHPAFSKLVGVSSIYCITPTTEEVALRMARELARYGADVLPVYIPQERQLARPTLADDIEADELDNEDEDDLPFDGESAEALSRTGA